MLTNLNAQLRIGFLSYSVRTTENAELFCLGLHSNAMRYYFDIREGDNLEEDVEGIDLPSSDAAHSEALAAARDMVAEYVRYAVPIDGMTFVIRDEHGKVVGEVPLMSAVK